MDYIDLQYYRVKITRFEAHPEVIGREALIERQHADSPPNGRITSCRFRQLGQCNTIL